MTTYQITGSVKSIDFTLGSGTGNGMRVIPPFTVEAKSVRDAEQLALEIVDPLDMTETSVTVLEIAPIPADQAEALAEALITAAEALDGDSNDEEHDALFSLAEAVSGVLGVELDDVRGGEQEEEDE